MSRSPLVEIGTVYYITVLKGKKARMAPDGIIPLESPESWTTPESSFIMKV